MLRTRTRGIFIWEAIAAMVLLAAVAGLLMTSMHARMKVDQRLDARLVATEAARTALLYRQAGKAYSAPEGVRIESKALDTPAGKGEQWIAVRATAGEDHVELIGLVPSQTKEAGTP